MLVWCEYLRGEVTPVLPAVTDDVSFIDCWCLCQVDILLETPELATTIPFGIVAL